MTTTQLAATEIAIGAACWIVSLVSSRRILAPGPTIGRSLGAVMVWAGIFGSLPYLAFVALHPLVTPPGMGAFAGLVLGSLPLWMLISPFVGLYMVLKRFSRYISERSRHTLQS